LDNPLKQGTDLFAQKRYAEAIPLFEQAAVKDPGNPNIQYYLAYACAMTQDNRGAALHFYKFNAMSPNPGVLAYADKLKASLPPLDQRWVEDQLAGRTNVARRTHMPFKKRGLRLIPALYLPSQNSMKSYAESVTAMVAAAQVYDPSMAANISLPTGFLEIQLQPCYELSPNFEFALSLNYASVGSLKTSLTSDVSYNYNSDIKFTEVGIGILGRYFFGRPEKKLRPFLGAGVLFAAAKSEGTYSYSYVDTPEYNYSVTGSSNAAGIGGQFELGVDFCPSPYFHMGPIVGYRFLKATKFGDSADSLDLDMGGPMAGIMLSAFY
jgi:hypothetical protein